MSPTRPLRVTLLNWRDTDHPEGGGSERYVEQVAAGLAAAGCEVMVRCAAVAGRPRRERRSGFALVRGGGRLGVYPRALLGLLADRLCGRGPDAVIDVQNGVPFFARLVAGCPVVVLVHHVHREQWPVALGPIAARLGWWLESRVAPRVYRGCRYVTVSQVSRTELVELGVAADRISVIHNGVDDPPTPVRPADSPAPDTAAGPQLVALGRLVPHKRIEHAVQVVAELRPQFPGLVLQVIGDGWWRDRLQAEAVRLGVADAVRFRGFVPEAVKHELLAGSAVLVAPSLKEGWGLMVVEAARHGVPAVAYRDAGGLAESVRDGVTGVLVADLAEMKSQVRGLLLDHPRRAELGRHAREHAARFSWQATAEAMVELVQQEVSHRLEGRPVAVTTGDRVHVEP